MSRVDMAADDKTRAAAPRGKQKKKSALAKLVEKKKRQASDADSEYGSRLSLQDSGAGLQSQSSLPLEPEVIVEHRSPAADLSIPHSFPENNAKPRPKPRRNSKVGQEPLSLAMDVDGNISVDKDSCTEGPDVSSKNVPSESTVYRFRNMRMAADQSDVTDGMKQGPFVPKPPSTPRTPRGVAAKGEKRNHEPYSSGDETDMKRQVSGSNGSRQTESTQSVNYPIDKKTPHTRSRTRSPSPAHSPHKLSSGESPTKVLGSPAISAVSSENRDFADDTMDQLHHHYQKIMSDNKGSPYRSLSSHSARLDASPRSRKLDPLAVKSTPPPMGVNMMSAALRTAYKSDPHYHASSSSMLHKIKTPMSDGGFGNGGASSARFGSDNLSFTSTSVMPVITTREARSRSFLVGSVSSGSSSILGAEELERYFPDRKLHVFTGSWNMNELKEMSISLNDFILPEACEYVQDIYAVGTQENELNKREWEIRLQETLGPSHVLFHSVSYGSLHLAIYIRRDLIWFCSVPEEDVVSLRAVTMVKTKGAIGVSFSVFGTSFLFINCHLTSDRSSSKNAHRLLDYHKVTQELRLPHHRPSKTAHPATKLSDATARFDCVFWCGDLNFRLERRRVAVEGKVSQMTAEDCIPHFEELLGGDQLSKLITEGKIFEGFQEGRINFQPTFKFDVNTDNYDSSSKNRIPSYTDRILFRSRKKNHISCLCYDAVMNIKVSDHRAVYALFEATIRPGRDNILLSAGQFDRDVYLEANKRRAQSQLLKGHKTSSVCVVQ